MTHKQAVSGAGRGERVFPAPCGVVAAERYCCMHRKVLRGLNMVGRGISTVSSRPSYAGAGGLSRCAWSWHSSGS